ncbi:MAG: H-type lectin domain-containing protein [Mycobacteriales bacterium]
MRIIHGKSPKPQGGKMTISFPQPFNQIPHVVVTPHWEKQDQGVGNVETISEISTKDFTVVSGNHAANYFLQWIAVSDE